MIDLSSSQTLTYTYSGLQYTIVIYNDKTNTGQYYILPQPVLQTGTNNLPVFALTEYSNGSEITGQCNFQTVLQTPPGAVAAVQNKYPNATIGTWNWSGGTAWFKYQYPDVSGQMLSFEAAAWPSLQPTTTTGTQSQSSGLAGWTVSLPTQAALQAFTNAFCPTGNGSFSIDYEMQVQGSLPGVKVVISFNSKTAYQYEQTVKVDKNVWGDVTKETTTINQYLQQSQAGTIDITWGAISPDSPTGKQITNWAFQTLQNEVQATVDQTIAMMKQNIPSGQSYTFSMDQVASLSTTFVENQVVSWYTSSGANLPVFSQNVWNQVYKQVDTKPLSVIFSLQNANLDYLGIDSVTIFVNSPSGNDQTVLTNQNSTWTFTKPAKIDASGKPDLSYTFYYVVAYQNMTSWQSDPATYDAQTKPTVPIDTGALKALVVEFYCDNVNFSGTAAAASSNDVNVATVEVDFSFVNPTSTNETSAQEYQESLIFTKNNDKQKILQYTWLPYGTGYFYSVKYTMVDGTTIVMAPVQSCLPNVSIQKPVLSPIAIDLNIAWADKMSNVMVYATWVDPNNAVTVTPQYWKIPNENTMPDTWYVNAPQNSNAYAAVSRAQYTLNGKFVQMSTPWYVQPPFIDISSTQSNYMVTIDPSLVDWNSNARIAVNVYLVDANNDPINMTTYQFSKGTGITYNTFFLDQGAVTQLNWYVDMTYYVYETPGSTKLTTISTEKNKITSKTLILPQNILPQAKLQLARTIPVVPLIDPEENVEILEAAHKKLWPNLESAKKQVQELLEKK